MSRTFRFPAPGKTLRALKLLGCTTLIIVSIGGCIGALSSLIAIIEGRLFSYRYSLVMTLLWPCCVEEGVDKDQYWLHGSGSMDCSACAATHAAGAASAAADVAVAAAAFIGFGAALMLVAAALCAWAPRAALSGLPQVHSHLAASRRISSHLDASRRISPHLAGEGVFERHQGPCPAARLDARGQGGGDHARGEHGGAPRQGGADGAHRLDRRLGSWLQMCHLP